MLRLLYFLCIFTVAILLSACGGSSGSEEASEATEAVQEAATQSATEDTAATAGGLSTAQATDSVTPEAQSLNPNNGSYSISVSYTLDGATMNSPSEDSSDVSDLVIVGSLANKTASAIEVSSEDISLVDTESNRYLAEPPNNETQPPLIGAEIMPSESFLGLVSFRLPAGTIPSYLEWCIAGDCEQAVQAPIP